MLGYGWLPSAKPRGLLSEEENAWLEVKGAWLEVKGACHPSDCSIQLQILVTLFCIVLSYKNFSREKIPSKKNI